MQTLNATVAIAGDTGTTVQKYGITVAELAVLRLLHGDDAVFDIEPVSEVARKHRDEIERLSEIYGTRQPDGRKTAPAVHALFPGAAARVFETLDELDLPEELFKPETRKRASTPKSAAQPVVVPADAPKETELSDMTVAKLKELAAEREIDLDGITKKADIVAAIEAADLAAADATGEDTIEGGDADEDGIGEMSDKNLFE